MNKIVLILFAAASFFIACEGDVEADKDYDAGGEADTGAEGEGENTDDDDDNNTQPDDDDTSDDDVADDDDNDDNNNTDDDTTEKCDISEYSEEDYGTAIGEILKSFELDSCSEDSTYNLDTVAGKKILWLVITAAWCPSCGSEAYLADQIYLDHKDEVEILWIMGEANVAGSGTITPEYCAEYADFENHPFPVLRDEGYKNTGKYFSLSGGIPLNILVDRCMKIRVKEEGWGPGSEDDFSLYIEMLLEEEQ